MAADFLRGLLRPPSHKCCICMEFYGTEPSTRGILEHAIELPCRHIVGSECIDMWLSPDFANRNTCPVCRHEFFPAQPRPYLEHGILGDEDSGLEDSDEDEIDSEEEDGYSEEEEDEDEEDEEIAEEEEEDGEQRQHEHREEHRREVFHTEEIQQERYPHQLSLQLLQQQQQEGAREQQEQLQQQQVRNQPLYQDLPHQSQQLEDHHRLRYHYELQQHYQLPHQRQQQQVINEEGECQDEESMDPDDGRTSTGEASEAILSDTTLHKRVQDWEEAAMAYLQENEAEMGAVEVVKQLNRSRDQLLYMQLVDITTPNPVTAQGIACLSTEQEEELFKALDRRGAFQDFVDARPDLTSTRDLWNVLRERGFNYYNVCDDGDLYRDEWRLSIESVTWECIYGNVRLRG